MLYLVGLGLNLDGISKYGLETVKRCKRVYLENYTVDFPYSSHQLSEVIGKKIILADREKVESLELVDEAKKMDVVLMVYGSPLTATTHISLIEEAKRLKVRSKVIYSASILDAIAGTGLQVYKFGKIASIPEFKADSFIEIVKSNQSIDAHTLLLADIGMNFQEALKKLIEAAEKHKIKLSKLLVCQQLGGPKSKVSYKTIEELKEYSGVKRPYCIIVPSKLHFLEKEFLENTHSS